MKLQHLFSYEFVPGMIYKIPNAPNSVLWDICYQCNQRCKYCYNSDERFKMPLPDYNKTKRILERICEWGVREIIYLGGEPTIFPNLWEILEQAKRKGIGQRLISNGAFINDVSAKNFSSIGVEIGISLHGTDAKVHDEITQVPGSFMKALEAITLLEKANAKWYLQYTPIREEKKIFTFIEKLKKQFSSLRLVDINRLMPHGRGSSKVADYQDEESLWECISDIPKINALGINVSIESIPHCWIKKRGEQTRLSLCCIKKILHSIRPCYMAINQIAMDDQGRLKLCPGGEGCTESILQKSPVELWKTAEPFARRRKFEFLPKCCIDYSTGTACEDFYNCGGGCKMTNSDNCSTQTLCDFLISR